MNTAVAPSTAHIMRGRLERGARRLAVARARRQREEVLWEDFVCSKDFPLGLTIRLQDLETDERIGRTGAARWRAEFQAYKAYRHLTR